jgi:DNA-binding MarR family transcriptional regulator
MTEHPALDLDETVHQRVRLGVLAILSETSECAFSTLRDELKLTDGNLSRHLQVLETAGLLKIKKGYEGKRPATWLRLTAAGRTALNKELDALQRLTRRARGEPS